mmetsp:Transcript_116870/g.372074  ORF Transcript_116870/g.372074 Transcript_116870/m.372074 type:complete len:211 (+) Transcript_116870:918-1550(+)
MVFYVLPKPVLLTDAWPARERTELDRAQVHCAICLRFRVHSQALSVSALRPGLAPEGSGFRLRPQAGLHGWLLRRDVCHRAPMAEQRGRQARAAALPPRARAGDALGARGREEGDGGGRGPAQGAGRCRGGARGRAHEGWRRQGHPRDGLGGVEDARRPARQLDGPPESGGGRRGGAGLGRNLEAGFDVWGQRGRRGPVEAWCPALAPHR